MTIRVERITVAGIVALMFVVVAGGAAFAQDLPVVFSDDFSAGAEKWEILWDPQEAIRPGDGYLIFGDHGSEVHMRIPGITTNHFNLLIDADIATGTEDWLGIRFGTKEGNPWYNGHLILVRPRGLVELFREFAPGELKRNDRDYFYLGSTPHFTGASTIELFVRPDKFEIVIDGLHRFSFNDINVEPGFVELYATNPGPMKLYYVELAAEVAEQ